MQQIHFILYVNDQIRSRDFYTAVLGEEPSLDVPGMTEFEMPGNAILGLMPSAGISRLLGPVLPDPTKAAGVPRAEIYLVEEDPEGLFNRALAAGATLAVIPEEFPPHGLGLDVVSRVLEGAILKRLAMNRRDGVAVIAEGILERLRPDEIRALKEAARDEHGNIRLSEIDLASTLKKHVTQSLKNLGVEMRIISNNIGYELRCAPPIPFDCEYTRNLGYGVVKFLLAGGTGAMVTLQGGRIVPVYFEDILDPRTGKTRVRLVETDTETYEVARKYMIRLERADLEDRDFLGGMASLTNLTPSEFYERYRPVVELRG